MTSPAIVSRDVWLKARKELLAQEKALMKRKDELAAARRQLPLVRIEADYRFDTEDGEKSLSELFGPHSQLIVYHFMFGPDWENGCTICSFWADHFDGMVPHLTARGTRFLCISNAPLERLLQYRAENGWRFDWASAAASTFSTDFGVSFYGEAASISEGYNYGGKPFGDEMPGLSVFLRLEDGTICHSYSTYARGLEAFNPTYQLLDLTPKGRDEAGLPFTMAWVKRPADYKHSA